MSALDFMYVSFGVASLLVAGGVVMILVKVRRTLIGVDLIIREIHALTLVPGKLKVGLWSGVSTGMAWLANKLKGGDENE